MDFWDKRQTTMEGRFLMSPKWLDCIWLFCCLRQPLFGLFIHGQRHGEGEGGIVRMESISPPSTTTKNRLITTQSSRRGNLWKPVQQDDGLKREMEKEGPFPFVWSNLMNSLIILIRF
jgi:hypothetical protein